jgi:hypothetical protein
MFASVATAPRAFQVLLRLGLRFTPSGVPAFGGEEGEIDLGKQARGCACQRVRVGDSRRHCAQLRHIRPAGLRALQGVPLADLLTPLGQETGGRGGTDGRCGRTSPWLSPSSLRSISSSCSLLCACTLARTNNPMTGRGARTHPSRDRIDRRVQPDAVPARLRDHARADASLAGDLVLRPPSSPRELARTDDRRRGRGPTAPPSR